MNEMCPLVMADIAIENGPVEIVRFPGNDGDCAVSLPAGEVS